MIIKYNIFLCFSINFYFKMEVDDEWFFKCLGANLLLVLSSYLASLAKTLFRVGLVISRPNPAIFRL